MDELNEDEIIEMTMCNYREGGRWISEVSNPEHLRSGKEESVWRLYKPQPKTEIQLLYQFLFKSYGSDKLNMFFNKTAYEMVV